MLSWLKKRFNNWAERYLKKEIERLRAENLRLNAEYRKATGETQIRLTPEEQKRLSALRKHLDPEWLKKHDAESGDIFAHRHNGLPSE